MLRAAFALLVLTLFGCASANTYARWPYRGPMIEVTNPSHTNVVVTSVDAEGRALVTARIKPQGRACFRWPFIHRVGYLFAESTSTQPFEPWEADGWSWVAGSDAPTPNPRACR